MFGQTRPTRLYVNFKDGHNDDDNKNPDDIQSGRSSPAKHGDAYFSAIYGFMKDPIAALGSYENQEC